MERDLTCPKCGEQQESSGEGIYCPSCYLSVGLEGVDSPMEDPLSEVGEKAGDRIDRFHLLEEIGEGGFGVVFRAVQEAPVKRNVALKVIKPGMDSREVVARFEAERQALALMNHPHIAKVYDAGTTALGRPFFVMELMEGLPLTAFCDKYRLSINDRLELFAKICSGVQHAHQKGIIHRDLKPGNILVHYDDNDQACPKIIDFGVAKAIGMELTEKTFFTLFGRLVGTPEYMSPEQAELNAIDVDTRSDIYALGVILHELLTGRTPLSREQLISEGYEGMRRMILKQDPPRSSGCYASLSQDERDRVARARQADARYLTRILRNDLDWIVMKAIEKNRTRRYETAQDLGFDVKRYLSGLPVYAGPPSRIYRTGKFVRRHRPGVAIASILVLLLIGGIINQRLSSLEDERLRKIAEEDAARSQRELRDRLVLNAMTLNPGTEGWLTSALDTIKQAAEIEVGEDLRNEALRILEGRDLEKVDLEVIVEDPSASVAFSSDHRLIALVRNGKEIVIRDRVTGEELETCKAGALSLAGCRLSFCGPENRYLVVAADPEKEPRLEVLDRMTGLPCFAPISIENQAFDILPEQKGLVIVQNDRVHWCDWAGKELGTSFFEEQPVSISLNTTTKQLVIGFKGLTDGEPDGRLLVFDFPAGTQLVERKTLGREPRSLSWSPSGRYLAMADHDKNLIIYESIAETEKLNRIETLQGHSTEIRHIAWSPDGRFLATATDEDREIRLWETSHWKMLSIQSGLVSNFSFFSDREHLHLGPVVSEERLCQLKILGSDVCYRAGGHRGGSEIRAFAWDSRLSIDREKATRHDYYSLAFATAGNDSVIVWDRQGGVWEKFKDVEEPAGLAFSPSHFYMSGCDGIVRREVTIVPGERFGPFITKEVTPCEMIFGDPEKISDLNGCHKIAVTPDGRLLFVASDSGLWAIDTSTTGTESKKLLIQKSPPDLPFALDSEGRWLVAVYNPEGATSGIVLIYPLPGNGELLPDQIKPARTLEIDGVTTLAFSGLWDRKEVLFATSDSTSYRFWKVGNDSAEWEEKTDFEIPTENRSTIGHIAFSPRRPAIAVSFKLNRLKVLDHREMKILIQPSFDRQWPLAFSEDGAIIATEDHEGHLFLWDLQAVRREFKKLGIDWQDLPDFTAPGNPHALFRFSALAGRKQGE